MLEKANDNRCDEADSCGIPDSDIAGRWSDADETGNSSFTGANDCEFAAVEAVLEPNPADDAGGGCQVGIPDGDHRSHARVECTTTVETEPARNQMRTVPRKTIVTLWGLSGGALEVVLRDSIDDKLTDVFLVQRPALAENKGICKTCRARRDVHWPTASEVEGTELCTASRWRSMSSRQSGSSR